MFKTAVCVGPNGHCKRKKNEGKKRRAITLQLDVFRLDLQLVIELRLSEKTGFSLPSAEHTR